MNIDNRIIYDILPNMVSAAENLSGNRVTNYLSDTLKDASGVRFAREVAGDHDVVSVDGSIVSVDLKAVGAGVLDVSLPIMSRVFNRLDYHYNSDEYEDDRWWLGFPASIMVEFVATAGAIAFAREHGSSVRESIEIFSALKGSEIGVATLGKDALKTVQAKASKMLSSK